MWMIMISLMIMAMIMVAIWKEEKKNIDERNMYGYVRNIDVVISNI